MNNYKLLIQYDGTNYCGWQLQKKLPTVQLELENALNILLKEKCVLIGSGRTDTGVHAWGQTANFKTEKEIDAYTFLYSLNCILPFEISVKSIEKVNIDFNSRFDAISRSYIYLFSHKKSPFYKNYSWFNSQIQMLDFDRLNEISKSLIGNSDFSSYSRKNVELENKFCDIKEIRWRKGKELSFFYITANRFLHGMVRTIIGTVLHAEKNKLGSSYLIDVLNTKDRQTANESVPAKGLFLFKVRY